ncbi:MAG TPA: hypothetical protein VK964_16870 [Nocardioidaceae bacterium]|nr:hypothetical protein [Nocardioidaceae bacterium]
MRWLFFAFLLGHAAVHVVMWTLPFTDAIKDMPFNPAHSWWFGDQRIAAVLLAGVVAVGYVIAGVGWLLDAQWWPVSMASTSALSLLLMMLFFAPWWLVGIALSGGLAIYALQALS